VTCAFTVVVEDNEDPTITGCPGNQTRDADSGGCDYSTAGTEFDPTSYDDNCPMEVLTYALSGATTGSGTNTLAGVDFQKGTTTVVWTVTDMSGNTETCSFDIVVIDDEDPTISCPGTQTRNTDVGECNYTAVVAGEFDPTGYDDNCPMETISNDYDMTSSLDGSDFPKGTTTVVWTVTDMSGNTETCSFDIVVIDDEDPTISCPGTQTRNTDVGECNYTAVVAGEFDPTGYDDNCPMETISNDYDMTSSLDGSDFPKGTTTVVWTVTDMSGNTETCSFDIVVIDNEDPTISCPGTQTRNTDVGECNYTAVVAGEFDPTGYDDNCPMETISNDYDMTSSLDGSDFPKGTTTVVWTVTDMSGNTETCSFDIVVIDDEDPTISCPGTQTRNTDVGECNYTAVVAGEFDPTGYDDNCPMETISNDYDMTSSLDGSDFPKGTTTVVWTVTDMSGNTETCSFDIVVIDDEDPTISCPGTQTRNTDVGECNYTAVVAGEFDPTGYDDNCPMETISNDYDMTSSLDGSDFPKGTTTVVWTVTDMSGNTETCSFDIVVIDDEDPTISCPGTQTRNTDVGECNYTAVVAGEFDPTGYDDNCPMETISNDYDMTSSLDGSDFPKGTTTVVWTVTDMSGNTETCSFDIVVIDDEDPTISCPGTQTRNTDVGECNYTAVVAGEFDPTGYDDNCPMETISNDYDMTSSLDGSDFPKGTTTVVWTVTDMSGNTETCSFDIVVIDNEDPTISCPGTQTRNTDVGECNYTAVVAGEFDPTGYDDNCPMETISNDYDMTSSLDGSDFPKGTTTVVWTVTDMSGNTETCSFDIVVIDNEDPTISCPGTQTRNTDVGECNYTAVVAGEFDPTGYDDNCPMETISNDYDMTSSLDGSDFPKGTTTVVWTVTDMSGNTETCSFDIVVIDNEDPTISCPGTQTRNTDVGECNYTAVVAGEFDPTGYDDNCPMETISNDYDMTSSLDGSDFPKGTTTVVWTVTDMSGNTETCSFDIVVIDDEDPTISCPGTQTRNTDVGECNYTAVVAGEFDPTGYDDNCPMETISNDYDMTSSLDGSDFPKGTTTVVWTVTDMSGNTETCSFDIVVIDNEDPTISCPGTQTRNTDVGECNYTAVVAGEFDPTGYDDNCPMETISNDYDMTSSLDGSDFPKGTTTVVWTVTDMSGNTETCSFDIVVIDNEDPTISCPGTQTRNTDVGECNYTAVVAGEFDPTGYDDNCPMETISNDYDMTSSLDGSDFPKGTTTVVWTVTDMSGNTETCSFDIVVIDDEDPTISCPGTQTRNTDVGECNYTAVVAGEFDPTGYDDNCPMETISNDYDMTSSLDGSDFPKGTTTVVWTVTDMSGNTETCSFDIVVIDDEDPTISCPGTQTRNTDVGECNYTAVVAGEFDPTGYDDNCPMETISNDYDMTSSLDGSDFPKGTTTVVWTVTDMSGNTETCSFDIVVIDDEDPTISCPGTQTRNTDVGECNYTAVVAGEFDPTGYDDNCPMETISNDYDMTSSLDGSDFPKGTTTVVWTVTDMSGNTETCSFDIVVIDNEDPTISCPGTQTRNTDVGECNYTAVVAGEFDPTGYDDNCPMETISNDYDMTSSLDGSDFPKGTTTVVWTVTDMSGNTETCSFDIVVIDNEDPTISCPGTQTRNTDVGECNYTAVVAGEFDPTGYDDNCPMETISNDYDMTSSLDGSDFPKGTTTVVWTVTDMSGNTETCSFDIVVIDNEDPTISCPGTQTRNTDVGECNYTAVVAGEFDPTGYDDNCPMETISNDYDMTSSLDGSDFPKGTTTVVWTVTDMSGNTETCSFDIVVIDDEDPTISCPGTQTRNTDVGECNYTAVVAGEFDPTGYDDNCPMETISNDYDMTSSLDGSDFPKGTTTVVWTVTDMSNNTASCTFNVVVSDVELPTISCPSNPSNRTTDPGVCDYTTVGGEFDPAFADNCPMATIENDYNNASTLAGAVFPVGTTTVEWTVTDMSGNTKTCAFDVVVVDDELPTVTCPPNVTLTATSGTCQQIHSWTVPVPADNCGVASMTVSTSNPSVVIVTIGTSSFALFPVGTTTVTYLVTDVNGNTNTCSFTVLVKDTENPVITGCPANIGPLGNDPGLCGRTVSWTAPTASDNCPGVSLATTHFPGSFFAIGTTMVTYTATDAGGLTATCSFTVTIEDTEDPAITCPADMTVGTDPGSCDAVVSYTAPVGTDNCPGASTSQIAGLASGATFPIGTTTNTFRVTDGAGNSTTCSFDVTVEDDEAPSITCPASTTVDTDPGVCTAVVSYTAPVGTDNCPGASTVQTSGLASGSSFPLGTTTNTFRVTDGAGNSTTCSFDVTVEDNEDPGISCEPAQTIVLNAVANCWFRI
jgi:hypothetical protein